MAWLQQEFESEFLSIIRRVCCAAATQACACSSACGAAQCLPPAPSTGVGRRQPALPQQSRPRQATWTALMRTQ